tara:strand:- start:217 stop:702 length:486 start_codon:yes stop_codon:yes gene_type:complete
MTKLNFLHKLKKKGQLELVDTSQEISQSYSLKSKNCLRAAKILYKEEIYESTITEAYYAMYNSALSLLFLYGIKSENHTGTIALLKLIFEIEKAHNLLENAKKERIDKQYYVTTEEDKDIIRESAKRMIEDTELFVLELRTVLSRTNQDKIEQIRKKLRLL